MLRLGTVRADEGAIGAVLRLEKDDFKNALYVAKKLGYDLLSPADLQKLGKNSKELETIRAVAVAMRRLNLDSGKSGKLITEILQRKTNLAEFFYQYALTVLSLEDGLRDGWKSLNDAIAEKQRLVETVQGMKGFRLTGPFKSFAEYRDAMLKGYASVEGTILDKFKQDLSDSNVFSRVKVMARENLLEKTQIQAFFKILRDRYSLTVSSETDYSVAKAKDIMGMEITMAQAGRAKILDFADLEGESGGKLGWVKPKRAGTKAGEVALAMQPKILDFAKELAGENGNYAVAKNEAGKFEKDAAKMLDKLLS